MTIRVSTDSRMQYLKTPRGEAASARFEKELSRSFQSCRLPLALGSVKAPLR
jgi:hypothetical protein